MNRKTRLISSGAAASVAAIVLSLGASGAGGYQEMHHGGNPLVEEMILLDTVFHEVVSGVALGDGHRVHAALEKMHGAMEKTQEGVGHGTVKLRRNAQRLNEFVRQDKQFHGMLEDLASASQKNDGSAMLLLTKKLLDGCVQCHREFRPSK